MENDFGWWRIAGIYFLSGIFGFIFGGNFAAASVPSVGCSGALFGFISCLMIDLIQNWYIIVDPWKQLIKFIVMIFLSFLMGVLPGVDNFSHIGGFFMGIFACLLFMPTIHFNKWDRRRKRIMRIIAIPIIIILYTVLLVTFYRNTADDVCPWCKYISCFGIKALCDFQNLQP
jgi:membrane associated rhomboid family serine protease